MSVWLLVGEDDVDLDVGAFVTAGFTDPLPAPQAAVAKTDAVNPAMIRFRFINAVSPPPGRWPACYTTDFVPILR